MLNNSLIGSVVLAGTPTIQPLGATTGKVDHRLTHISIEPRLHNQTDLNIPNPITGYTIENPITLSGLPTGGGMIFAPPGTRVSDMLPAKGGTCNV